MKNKKFAFLINFGIEYRNFILSDLISDLSKDYETVVLRKNIENKNFDEYIKEYKINELIIEKTLLDKKRGFFERIFHSIRQSFLKVKNIGNFRNYNEKSNKKTIKDYVKANFITYNIFKLFTFLEIKNNYIDSNIQNILKNEGITDILISGYASQGSIAFATNAIKANLRVWVFVNSWKDFYVNDFVPFIPNGLFLWSQEMKDIYSLTNTHINNSIMHSSGNIVFDKFFNPKINYSKIFYSQKYMFDENSKILLYSMLDPDRYTNEIKIIELISNRLKETSNFNFTILVKKNPFDLTQNVENYFLNSKNIKVLEHFSNRDKENDFFVQSLSGEKEWLDILYYCNLNIGAASTVALEALMMDKPVITIGFNNKGNSDDFLINIADAAFYKKLLEREDVFLAKSLDESIDMIDNILSDKQINNRTLPKIIGKFDGNAKNKILKVLKG